VSAPEDVIVLEGVTKSFSVGFFKKEPKPALRGISFRVRQGSSFGFLGPNGAGKTTTIKILVGLIAPSGGKVSIFGSPPKDLSARRRFGYLPENPSLPDGLSGGEVLRLMCALSGVPSAKRSDEIHRVLKLVDLVQAERVVVRKYSKGMVQRLGIAQALLGDPDLVILDEPMSGLDPVGRREMKDLFLDLGRRGKTLLFSTHIISDAEEVCDDLAIIVSGDVVKSGSVSELIGGAGRRMEVLASDVPADFKTPSTGTGGVAQFTVEEESALRPLIESLWARGAKILAVKPLHYGLEDVFINAIRSRAQS
jgi:ABC-2 type transport system ATP-binding protein